MKFTFAKLCFATLTAAMVSACGPDAGSVNDDADPGRADFSVFVAVGDSLTAGYADGALYRQIQENSYDHYEEGGQTIPFGGTYDSAANAIGIGLSYKY